MTEKLIICENEAHSDSQMTSFKVILPLKIPTPYGNMCYIVSAGDS